MIRAPLFKYFRDSTGSSELISKEKNRASVYVLHEIDWKSKYWKKKSRSILDNNPGKLFFMILLWKGLLKLYRSAPNQNWET